MRTSTVQPQNYVVNTAQETRNNNVPTKKCILFFAIINVVTLIVIAAITVPVVLTVNRNKVTSQPATTLAAESTTAKETKISTPRIAMTSSAKIVNSFASNDDTSTTTSSSKAITLSAVSNTLTTSVKGNKIETASVNTLSTMKRVSSGGWASNMPTTAVASTDTTDETAVTASIKSTLTEMTPKPTVVLNYKTDTIFDLYNTKTDGSIDDLEEKASGGETAKQAMDRILTTKYFNKKWKRSSNETAGGPGIGSGFLVIPSISNSTVACGIRFATANDRFDRDPITVTLEGSNTTDIQSLQRNSSWILLYNGSTGIDITNDPGRNTYMAQQNFSNTEPFAIYRLLITSKRNDSSDAVQYSEAEIIGYN